MVRHIYIYVVRQQRVNLEEPFVCAENPDSWIFFESRLNWQFEV
jgi:hypothetical protein